MNRITRISNTPLNIPGNSHVKDINSGSTSDTNEKPQAPGNVVALEEPKQTCSSPGSFDGEWIVSVSFRVGEFLVEPELNSISKDGYSTRVEPKVMQVLVCLCNATDKVVSKERLIQNVWADTFVTDDVLTRAISELRKEEAAPAV